MMEGTAGATRDHRLEIGSLDTECAALVSLDHEAALRGRLERVTRSALPAALPPALGPVLNGLDGTIRIRELNLDVEYFGAFNEEELARLLAARIAAALRAVLRSDRSDALERWPDQAAYLAAYIERRLALTFAPAPSWAFEELRTLDHLPPERAAAEMLRERPEILIALARNAAAEADPLRFALALEESSARSLIDALLDPATPPTEPEELVAWFRLMDAQLLRLAISEPARAALCLTLLSLTETDRPPIAKAVAAATLVAALVHLRNRRDEPGEEWWRPEASTATTQAAASRLSPSVVALVKKHVAERPFRQRLEDVLPVDLDGERPGRAADDDATAKESTVEVLRSPVAGISLLLPAVAELHLADHLAPRQLHDSLLSVLGPDQQGHALGDPLFGALFPFDRHDADRPVPPVPEALTARLAPETEPLLTGDGLNAWGDLALAAFATRLPGLRASSRAYLQNQFVHTPGRLILGEMSVELTLQGPDLAIVLKMAGLSGVQRKLPHLGNRLLILTLTGLI